MDKNHKPSRGLCGEAELLPLQNIPFGILIVLSWLFLRNKRLRKKNSKPLNLLPYQPKEIQIENPAKDAKRRELSP